MELSKECLEAVENGFKTYKTLHPEPSSQIDKKELAAVNKKAYLAALEGFLKTAYQREMVRNFMDDGTLPYTPKDPVLRKMLENQANAVTTKPPYMMVTVNPRPGVEYAELSKTINKFIKKKSISQYFYVYEVRTEDTGIHCHILLKYDIKPFDFKRSAKNTFKNICDSSNPSCLNFKFLEEDLLPQKVEYLLGHKKDSKKAGVTATDIWRKKNNISPYVESSPPFPCRATQEAIVSTPEPTILEIE